MDSMGFRPGTLSSSATLRKSSSARATVQVAALAHPWSLVEIEVVAAR